MTRLILALMLVSGCAAKSVQADMATKTFTHNELERTYHVYTPAKHTKKKPVPLVIALHGGGGQGLKFDASTNGQMRREADERGWVVVYPEGIQRGWNDGRKIETRRDRARQNVDDVDFISTLIEQIQKDYGIDPDRVYATGISNGGFMSVRLAIDIPDQIAAVAAVTAQVGKHMEDLRPSQAVGVLLMNGTNDPLVPYYGGQVRVLGRDRGEILSTEDSIKWWIERNECADEPTEKTLPNTNKDDGTTTVVFRYKQCADNKQVVLYRVVGGGHTWPGGMQYLPKKNIGPVARDFDAAEHIFDFFDSID